MPLLGAKARKSLLTLHVLVSVGWFGAVAAFLAVATAGLLSVDTDSMIGMYAVLDVLIWVLIVPMAGLSLISGIAQAIGTPWGLLRHYWVIAKLLLTAGATVVLLLHTGAVSAAAEAARDGAAHFGGLRTQLVVDSAAALVVLALATVLSVVKPRGMTPWARRAARGEDRATAIS